MPEKKILTAELTDDINRVGNAAVLQWFLENEVELGRKGNVLDLLESALEKGTVTIAQIRQAVAELEENGNKKIFLFNVLKAEEIEGNKKRILQGWAKNLGITLSTTNWITGVPKESPTFIYLYWADGMIKLKYLEKQYEIEVDIEKGTVQKTPKTVCVILLVNTVDGFAQVRLDTPYTYHRHKNDEGRISEKAYEQFYIEHLKKTLFPDNSFPEAELTRVANYLVAEGRTAFRLNKGVATITGGAKQTYATPSSRADIRDIPEYAAAAENRSNIWRAEDLTGYWLSGSSDGKLNRDLFMRISRRQAHIRVQRGCLAKELDYGIEQIRKIQKTV